MRIRSYSVVLVPLAVVLCCAVGRAVAREEPARTGTVAANLRQIADALAGYAGDYKGRYPTELGAFAHDMKLYRLEPEMFLDPAGGKSVPPDVRRDTAVLASWINRESDVMYTVPASARLAHVKPTTVVVMLRPRDDRGALTVAFADGTVVEYVRAAPAGDVPSTPASPATAESGP